MTQIDIFFTIEYTKKKNYNLINFTKKMKLYTEFKTKTIVPFLSGFQAFTLAEVLITLGIIGIVAAITVPTLIQNYNMSH